MMAAVFAAMTLGELLGPAAGSGSALEVTDLVSDSRLVTPGAAFVALAGQRHDGLDFAPQAIEAGAVVVLHESLREAPVASAVAVPDLADRLGELGRRFFGRKRLPDGLIGITGTNGKTTVAWLVAQALQALGEPAAYVGTLGHGAPGALCPQALTTPDCLTLHRLLATLDTDPVALEVSSHALVQDRIAGVGFDTAVFTNLSHDHLDLHGSIAAYFEAKATLFTGRPVAHAVVNAGDSYGRRLLDRLPDTTTAIGVALGDSADAALIGRIVGRSLDGLTLELRYADASATLESRLIGDFNGENLLLATGVLVARGYPVDAAAAALAQAGPPPGRMEVFGGSDRRPRVIVDYAHTPAALERVLSVARAATDGRLICVFGCGGLRDATKRAPMGAIAARLADRVVVTDDNPRDEDPARIVADILEGAGTAREVTVVHAREEAIVGAIAMAGPGDLVVVAGKGHETTQSVGGVQRVFDDRSVVRRALGMSS